MDKLTQKAKKMSSRKVLSITLGFVFFIYCLLTISDYNVMWDGRTHFVKGQAFANFFLDFRKTYKDLPVSKEYARYYTNYSKYFTHIDLKKRLSRDPNYRRSIYQEETYDLNWFMKREATEHPVLSDIGASFFNIFLYEKLGIVRDDHAYALFAIVLASILAGVVFYWGTSAYGIFPGLITAIVLITTPLFLAESHYNIKDIPLLVFFSLAVFAFWKGFKSYSLKWIFISSVLAGLALGTKFNALFLPIIIFSWVFLDLIIEDKKTRKRLLKWWWVIFAYPLIMFSVLTMGWPQMWHNPISAFFNVIAYYKLVGVNIDYTPAFRTIFNISTYPSIWIFYTTYPFVILLVITGVFGWIKSFKRTKDTLPLLFIIWFLIPLTRASLPSTSIFGGVRHIIEYIVPVALLAGYGVYFFLNFQKKRANLFKTLILIAFIPFVFTLIKLHPAENVYFNSFVGGINGARTLNLTGWGNTDGGIYEVAMKWINKNAERNSHIAVGYSETADFYLPGFRSDLIPDNTFSGYLARGEYIIALTHNSELESTYRMLYPQNMLKPLYVYSVGGVPLVKIWKNDKKYLKTELKNLKEKNILVEAVKDGSIIKWDLQEAKKIVSIKIDYQKDKSCKDLESAYFEASDDGVNWKTLPEAYPTTVIDETGLQPKGSSLIAPMAGIDARSIKLLTTPPGSCLENSSSATITVLEK